MRCDLEHTFVTSDHHFKSYKLPFLKTFTQEQEKILVKKWNSIVSKDDLVYYNGDFCDGDVSDLCQCFKQLNGNIVLIKGNHDILPNDVYKAIFKDVVDEVVLNELDLTIHHCPGNIDTKFEVFGHLHRDGDVCHQQNKFCSCIQFNDGYPVSLSKIMKSFR